jgi:lysine 2,3-aminomutase
LYEKRNSPIKGVVYKFRGRIVVLLSYTCAANCRYCERQDRVGVGLDSNGYLRPDEIQHIVSFIEANGEINEVILSGGDPLMNPGGLKLISGLLSKLEQIKILRIHTRVPVQQPGLVDLQLLSDISSQFRTCYFSVHIDHPDELTTETEDTMLKIRRAGYIMLAQSVFLKGINDDFAILRSLFLRLSELGIRPYYIYHCQAIPTTMRFVMHLEEEIKLMTQLREHLSGIAFPQHVIDVQHTIGKILVPTNHWHVDLSEMRDFKGAWLATEGQVMRPLEA